MSTSTSTTRWQDEPIIPEDYNDVRTLVEAARRVRGRIVEFDWVFTLDDVSELRDAVFEWGTPTVGQYKCFAARVLAAINGALADTNTVKVLNEPKNSGWANCACRATRDENVIRLQGHAPFDVVFGYGIAAIGQNVPGSLCLGPTARETLVDSVGLLGWDLRRLQEQRLAPVQNALFGLRLDYGVTVGENPVSQPAVDVAVHFFGPFSATELGGNRCLFTEEIANRAGVYLWTIQVEGQHRPWYVGQTRRGFGARMAEHLTGFLSGQYTTYDAVSLSRGDNRLAVGAVFPRWPETLPSFLHNYERLVPHINGVIRLLNIHAAPIDLDKHLYDRVEGALGRHYHSQTEFRDFFFPGGLRVPAAIPFEKPIRLVLSSDVPVGGLPQYLSA